MDFSKIEDISALSMPKELLEKADGGIKIELPQGAVQLNSKNIEKLKGKNVEVSIQKVKTNTYKSILKADGKEISEDIIIAINHKSAKDFAAFSGGKNLLYKHGEVGERIIVRAISNKDIDLEPLKNQDFKDINDGMWFGKSVDYVSKRGLFKGDDNGNFVPYGKLSRAELFTVLFRIQGEPQSKEYDFEDVAKDSWYSNGVFWAYETGLSKGYGDSKMGPIDDISREQLMVMLYRFSIECGFEISDGKKGLAVGYKDGDNVSEFAKEAVNAMLEMGILNGADGEISPKDNADRGQVATVLERYIEKIIFADFK